MDPYQNALHQLALKESARVQRSSLLFPGMDSTKSEYVQKLDSLRSNEIHRAVSDSVDYEEPGLLDQAVSLPGRLAHSVALGFVDSAADLIELPELIVNHVGDNLGWDEDDRLNVLHYVADSVRGTVTREEAYNTVADKIAYYVGYAVPDLAAMSLAVLGGEAVAGGVAAGLLRTGARTAVAKIPQKALMEAGRMMGVVGYGALKGGAFGGTEGAIQGAKDFSIIEAGTFLLSRYAKPVQILGTALLSGGVTALNVDSTRADYDDEVIASAILGGMFAMMPSGQKDKILRDPDTAKTKVKAYIAREKALGREPNLNTVAMEFAERDWNYLHRTYKQDPTAVDPLRDLIKNMEVELGEGKVNQDPNKMALQLRDIILKGNDINVQEAHKFADSFVQSAMLLSNPDTVGGPAVLEKFIDLHRDKLIVPSDEPLKVYNKKEIINELGQKEVVSDSLAKQIKLHEAKKEMVVRGTKQLMEKQTKTIKSVLSDAYTKLANPEGPGFDKLLKVPTYGKKIQNLIKVKGYDIYDQASAIVERATNRIGFRSFEGKQKEALDMLITAQVHEDRFLYDIYKNRQKLAHDWTPEYTKRQREVWSKWIIENEGPEALNRYTEAANKVFKEFQELNKLKLNSGIIDENTYKNYMSADYLPGKRAVYWRPNTPFTNVEESFLLKNDPIFKETFGFYKPDPRLKGHGGEPMVYDTQYILSNHIKKTHYAVVKNNLLNTWWEAANNKTPGISEFARLPNKRYRIKGTNKILNEQEIREVLITNERLTRAAKNVRKRRQEKIADGEYSYRKKTPKEPSIEKLREEIKKLEGEIKKEEARFERFNAHAKGDFDKYDIVVNKEHPCDVCIYDSTEEYLTIKAIRDELKTQKKQLESLNKRVELEEIIEPMAGFEAVTFMRNGKKETVMLDRQAAQMTNLSHNVSKLENRMLKTVSIVSGTLPVKFLATAINPIFPIRRWWSDNKFFFLANPYESGNLLSLTKNAFVDQFIKVKNRDVSIFKDVINRGELTEKYLVNGGAQLTLTQLAQHDFYLRRFGDAFGSKQGKAKSAWEWFVDKAGWLGTNIELTIRVHQFHKLMQAGKTPQESVRIVNDLLNYGRKGHFMRYIDSIYPFANVAAQVLDSHARAFKTNPKLFAAKLAQYTTLRVASLWAAYTLGSEVMDDVNPYQLVKNWIVPLGLTTTDANGDTQRAYISIPTENSPFIQAIDALLVAGARITTDKTDTRGFEDIINRLADAVPMYDVTSFIPIIQAYKAVWKNRDPRTGDNIYRNGGYIDPMLQYYGDTSPLAKNLAKAIPGASPVGLERLGGMFASNPFINFAGYLLRDVTPEEHNSMSRAVTEAVPGLKGFVKWTRPQTDIARQIIKEEASSRQQVVGSFYMQGMKDIQSGDKTIYEVVKELNSSAEINGLEKRELVKSLKKGLRGWKLYQRMNEQEDPEDMSEIPALREWQLMSHQQTKAKVRWYVAMKPEKGTKAEKLFVSLAKVHGFLSSKKFFYYLRQFERSGEPF